MATVNGHLHNPHHHHYHHNNNVNPHHLKIHLGANPAGDGKSTKGSGKDSGGGTLSPGGTLTAPTSREHVFDQFVTACTCKAILSGFSQLLDVTGLRHVDHTSFYPRLKNELRGSWRAQSLWARLDKRWAHREYRAGQACSNIRALIIGAGPCGLRTAIECALLGAKTVVVEKRDRFSRNNVLHLWPYLITDLKGLGAKKFFGKFCAGAIDHISIRQLQCILMKVALLLGVEIHVNVSFDGLIEPPEDQTTSTGWRCQITPADHVLSEYVFDVLVGADGKRNTLPGFNRKEFRGKLAIAITANFINRNSQMEARVEEISGVAFIFNQKFFLDLKESTRIDLENIVYYKDDTHYFVMTAKKASLLEKGVLKEDHADTTTLLDRSNVNQEALMAYAREAANFSTNYQLPSLDYANNHYGQADVAMFDFTSMFAAENASRFVVKNGHHLLMALVGDSLLEPFWPTGSGCARGFLGAFDLAWMIRGWALGRSPLQVLAERESIFTVLSQTTPNYLHKNHNLYTIDPNSRYPNLNLKVVKPRQVVHLYQGGEVKEEDLEEDDALTSLAAVPPKRPRNEATGIDSYTLLRWCQRVLNTGKYRDVHVVDLTSSWRSGLALCALIHSFRPELINNTLLLESDVLENNRMAFQIAEKELGISPVMSAEDMAKHEIPDKLTMVSYLSQFYELFKHEVLPSSIPLKAKRKSTSSKEATSVKQPKSPHSPNRRTSFLQKLSARLAKSKKRKEQEMNEGSPLGSKKLKEKQEPPQVELTNYKKLPMEEIANRLQLDRGTDVKINNKTEERSGAVSVTAMADLLVAKFKSNQEQPPPEPVRRLKGTPTLAAASSASEFCTFCHKRVYLMERMSAEGAFFHRQCLKCDHCGVGLRLTNYFCDREAKPVKFYCYRHALPEMRLRPARKRGLEEEEETKENVPEKITVTPAPEANDDQASREKSPRKNTAHLSPLTLPPTEIPDKPGKTPERIEFEISFDGAEEESEEEQFEHNLRASLSSDTLLDDVSSDSDSDESFESGEDDEEVWENAVESLGLPADPSGLPSSPLTLEEACQFVNTWRRQHSREDLDDEGREEGGDGDGEERKRLSGYKASAGYTRFGQTEGAADEEDGEEDDEDDEDSSTEVEGDSEYETESTSEEEEEMSGKSARNVAYSRGISSATTPMSPGSRFSASKASFFSMAPTPVSLDPLSMFGMGKPEPESAPSKSGSEVKHDEEVEDGKPPPAEGKKAGRKGKKKKKRPKKIISSTDNSAAPERVKPSSVSERVRTSSESRSVSDSRGGDLSPKDTDVSESLEMDYVGSPDLRKQRVPKTGSLEELRETFSANRWAEEDTEDQGDTDFGDQLEREGKSRSQSVESSSSSAAPVSHEVKRPHSILKHPSVDLGVLAGRNVDQNEESETKRRSILKRPSVDMGVLSRNSGSFGVPLETGSDDGDDERCEEEDDVNEKTAVSIAMEQLLQDIDHKDQESPARVATSDSGDNEVYIEGRLSPSGLKTRKFRLKRQSRKSKGEQRRMSKSGTSDSEAARTDPTTTDNSLTRSSVSRSPSVEVTPVSRSPSVEAKVMEAEVTSPSVAATLSEKDEAEDALTPVKSETVSEIGRVDLEHDEAGGGNDTLSGFDFGTGTGGDTLQRIMEDVAAMPDLSDKSDLDELVIANIDDKFVTSRRGGPRKKRMKKVRQDKQKKKLNEVSKKAKATTEDVHSSFSISTPSGSDSESSVSSVVVDEFAGQTLDIKPGDDDIKPDADMLKDYTTTMSLALGESYSDAEVETDKDAKQPSSESSNGSGQKEIISPPASPADDLSSPMCNNERSPIGDSSAARNSSVYITPNSSVSEQFSETSCLSPGQGRPLPVPKTSQPVPQPRKSLPSPTLPPTPVTPLSGSSHILPKASNLRDSSGSDVFVSPVENMSAPPFFNKSNNKDSPMTSVTSPSSSILNKAFSEDEEHKSTSSTKALIPDSKVQTSKASSTSSTASATVTKPKSNPKTEPASRPQRKLPQLPKLNVLNSQPFPPPSRPSTDQPAMCSSPKLAARRQPLPQQTAPASTTVNGISTSTASASSSSSSRPLPMPNKSSDAKKASSSIPKVSASKPPQSPSVARVSSVSKPTFSDAPSFSKPVTKPVFKPPLKTKISLDKAKLRLGSSSDKPEQVEGEHVGKKKISASGIVIPTSAEDDIPFADESDPEEIFYTPCATEKKERPNFATSGAQNPQARKRILPSPPGEAGSKPGTPTPGALREMKQAEMEKAKLQARERARLKSDEELGLSTPSTPVRGVPQPKVPHHIRNSSYDTASTSDVLSDSDDKLMAVSSPAEDGPDKSPNTAAESEGKKKKKKKSPKGKKQKKDETKDSDSDKKGRKSLLSLILPAKSKNGAHDGLSSDNSTPKGSDDNMLEESPSNKAKKHRSNGIKYKKEAKQYIGRASNPIYDLDKTPTAETNKDLAICSVFHSEATKRPSKTGFISEAGMRTIPLAPKASGDEYSDSDESHVSFSTMQKRRDEDLEERVARRLRKLQVKQQRQAQQKRLRMAQEIQRQLEEVEVRQRDLEDRGIAVEKALRGDGPDEEDVDESALMSEWFTLVHEKNALLRYESELNVRAKELELEDRQARLELDFRERSRLPESSKTDKEIVAEGKLLDELLDVVEQRNNLVAMLEEDRLREQKEDKDLKEMMVQKGFTLSPLSFDTRRERQRIEAPLASVAL